MWAAPGVSIGVSIYAGYKHVYTRTCTYRFIMPGVIVADGGAPRLHTDIMGGHAGEIFIQDEMLGGTGKSETQHATEVCGATGCT